MMVVATLETGTSSCFSHRDPGDREVDDNTLYVGMRSCIKSGDGTA
jgi:hypothetical protein